MQNQQFLYTSMCHLFGKTPDEAPVSGELGAACAHLCRLMGINPLQEAAELIKPAPAVSNSVQRRVEIQGLQPAKVRADGAKLPSIQGQMVRGKLGDMESK